MVVSDAGGGGVPRRYRLRVYECLLVIEYAAANGVSPGEPTLQVHDTDNTAMTLSLVGGWRSRIHSSLPGAAAAPASGASRGPHSPWPRRLQLRPHADIALALAGTPAAGITDDDPARRPRARTASGEPVRKRRRCTGPGSLDSFPS